MGGFTDCGANGCLGKFGRVRTLGALFHKGELITQPRSASPFATAATNGCDMPAPAPCANTKQTRAAFGACNRPDTSRVSSTVMVTGCGVVEFDMCGFGGGFEDISALSQ